MKTYAPYSEIESWLYNLPRWKDKLGTLEAQRTHVPGLTQKFELVAIHAKGQKNETILTEVIRRLHAQELEIPLLELKIQMLEASLRTLLPTQQKFVESRYFLRLSNADVMQKLIMTPRVYFGTRKTILEKIYIFAGGPNSILGVPEDLSWLEREDEETIP